MKVSHKGSRIMALALCMVMVLAVAAPSMAANIVGYVTITASSATVYSSATKATVIGTFAQKDVVAVVSNNGTMWGVGLNAGAASVGYIDKSATDSTANSIKSTAGGKAVATITAASAGTAAATQTLGVIFNVKTDVNFRKTPPSGEVITKLKLNQEVVVLGEESGFYQVTANGQTGYVSKQYVRITSQATAQAPVVATPGDEAIAAQGLMKSSSTRAYKEADTKSGSAGTIAARAIVDISGQTGDFYKVTSGKVTGYVQKSAVTVLPTVSAASGTVTANAAAKLYEAASTSSKSSTSVPKGKTATVSGETSAFYKVTYNNKNGFVEKTKVTLQGGSTSSVPGGVQGTAAPSTGGTGKVTLGTGKIRVEPSVPLSTTSVNAMAAAKKINSDVFGYLNVPGTNIQQPILYNYGNLGKTVHYYADHTIEKKKATKGAIYSYYKDLARNNVVNGHNMRGSNDMTHQLHHLQEKALGYATCQTTDYKCSAASLANVPDMRTNANARVFEISLFGYTRWEVYAMYEVPANENKNTLNNNIDPLSSKTPAQVKTWIEGQIARSQVKFNVDVSTDDVLMTLYTCGTNYDYSTAQSRLYFFLKAIG